MKWLIALVSIVLVGCGAPPVAEVPAADPAVAVELATVKVETMRDTVSIDGSLVLPEGATTNLAPSVPGKLTQINVKEGDRVVSGQLLASIDTRSLVAQSQSAISGAASAGATARQTELAYRASIADQAASVEAARLAVGVALSDGKASVEQATADLEKLRAGARPQEVAQSQQAVDQAKVARDKAKLDADRDQQLLAEGLVAGSQADASQAALLTSESVLKSAVAALDLLKVGARIEDIHAAEKRLISTKDLANRRAEQARAVLRQAETGKIALSAKQQEATAAQLAASQKQSDAQAAIVGITAGEIRSPIDGYVVRRFLNVGDVADLTTPVLTISKSKPTADFLGNAPPTDVQRIREGMSIEVGPLRGTVTSVGQPDPATGLVSIRAHLLGVANAGGFATAKVIVRSLTNVVNVPTGAVLERENQNVVFVVTDNTAKMVEVTLGPEENGRIAILSGISSGAQVVILGGHELSDGAKVVAADKATKP